MHTMRARNAFFLFLLATVPAACAEGGRAADDGGTLLPVDAGKKRDAGSDAADSDQQVTDGGASDSSTRHDAGGNDANSATDSSTDNDSAVTPTPPVADGTINPGEYGSHVDGQNMQTSDVDAASPAAWYMTWDASNLYVAVTSADVSEGVILYIDTNPHPASGGTDADGSLTGQPYDATKLAPLPFRADFVAYVKSSYNEVRTADGLGAWSAPSAGVVTQVGTGNVREIVIPWSVIRSGGRPGAFSWLGYATSAGGYAYAEMPPANPGGAIGTSATFTHFYDVTDATPFTGTKPFAKDTTP